MDEKGFLDILTKITAQHRLARKGADQSEAFARLGHPDGGPGRIRSSKDSSSGPICEAALFLLGKRYNPQKWRDAARVIGLPDDLALAIERACELSLDRDPKLYHRLLDACSLPHSAEDEEDLETASPRSN